MPGGHTTNYVFLLGSAGLDIDCLVDRPLIIPFVEVTGFGVYILFLVNKLLSMLFVKVTGVGT